MILAGLLASFAHYMLGWLWHSHIFANAWMAGMNLTEEQIREQTTDQHMALALAGSFLIGLVQTIVITLSISYFGMTSVTEAVLFAGSMSLSFNFLSMLRSFLWVPKSFIVILINAGYNFVGSMVIAAIVSWMIL
ncbi:MAG TPA: DUF1761 domain-containing protein [Patescibacteria group bacterium]|jgi:hypothetical protein|nr:DUF1761 domain-containing protein [Patescibacteria group bacterium]